MKTPKEVLEAIDALAGDEAVVLSIFRRNEQKKTLTAFDVYVYWKVNICTPFETMPPMRSIRKVLNELVYKEILIRDTHKKEGAYGNTIYTYKLNNIQDKSDNQLNMF